MIRGCRRYQYKRSKRHGSIAMLFIPIMVVVIGLVGVIVHVAQLSLQQVMTSNAADAGCLAGASWIASGINECTWIHRKSETTRNIAMGLLMVPYCPTNGPIEDPYNASAEQFWSGLMNASPTTGPFAYFSTVCEGVIEEGWRMGAVGTYTGFVNNLVIRGAVDEGGEYFENQQSLYQNPGSVPSTTVEWMSNNITQVAEGTFTYPGQPQVLFEAISSTPLDSWGYMVYRREPLDWEWYSCDDDPSIDNGSPGGEILYGMRQVYQQQINITNGANGVELTGLNPLRIINNQVKAYEYAMGYWDGMAGSGFDPTGANNLLGDCNDSCGAKLVALPNARTGPTLERWVAGVTVDPVSVESSHEFGIEEVSGDEMVYFVPRGETIVAGCTAEVGAVPLFSPEWAVGGEPYWYNNTISPEIISN